MIHTCSHPGLLLYHCVPSAASARAEHRWSQAGCQGESGPHAGFGPQPKFILFKNAALPHPLSSYSPPFLWWATWETAGSNLLTVLSWLSLQERRLFGSKQIAKLDRLQLSAFFVPPPPLFFLCKTCNCVICISFCLCSPCGLGAVACSEANFHWPPLLSYQCCRALLRASLPWACNNTTWMSNSLKS